MSTKNILLLALGAIALVIGLALAISRWQFMRTAAISEGTVVALPFGGSHPKIEFALNDKRLIAYHQGGVIGGYKLGDKVKVLYLESDPSGTACVDAIGAIWAAPIILTGISLALICSSFFKIQ